MFNKIGKAKKFIEFLFEKKEFEEWIESRNILKSGQGLPDFKRRKEKLKCE